MRRECNPFAFAPGILTYKIQVAIPRIEIAYPKKSSPWLDEERSTWYSCSLTKSMVLVAQKVSD